MLTFLLALRVGALLASAVACVTDLRARIIPNWLTLSAWGLACGVHAMHRHGSGLWSALLASAVCAAVPCFLFVRGGMGGGDVKMFAALGATLGMGLGLEVQLHAFTLVALYALAQALWQGRLSGLLVGALRSARVLFRARAVADLPAAFSPQELPMGGAIFLAVAGCALRGLPW
jgi:prepilin peptidase CpaA